MPEKKAKILLDVPVDDGVLGFDNYRDALINIIKSSDPRFTIGIFGGWGTGKTTLMRMMKKKLDDEGEVTVWFNPWQFEKERHLMVPLLQTLKLELETKHKDKLKEILRTIGDIASSLTRSLKPEINLGITKIAFDAKEFVKEEEEKKDFVSLYFALNEKLNEIIQEIKKDRIVIFVDDLDRCLPDKALQVLESAKLFLDAEGYVFVVGLDRNIIEKCVSKKYGVESGISGIDYIKKIIQVPFNLPALREQEVMTYVQRLKEQLRLTEVEKHVEKYMDIISKRMEANPREIKRFINNFILVNLIGAGETEPDKLLVLLIIQFRWEGFYNALAVYKSDFLASVLAYIEENRDLKSDKGKKDFMENWGYLDLIEKTLDNELKSFLKEEGKIIFGIQDFDPYIHFSKATIISEAKMPIENRMWTKEQLLFLLQNGYIERFNEARQQHPEVDLKGAYLQGRVLSSADLSGANLAEANLQQTILEGTIFRRANLADANLNNAFLNGAVLESADLTRASLVGANLSGTDMRGANLNGIVTDNSTYFYMTIIQNVKNLSPVLEKTLQVGIINGVKTATSISVIDKV